ncbi:MAG: bifunctional UDP-N-acetylglucosamine diphosphorylase/glucosamine-1-phosphate N-acetyltransferase GlmU [Pseudomonadota bacterium]
MTKLQTAAIILAAGKGTRMKSRRHKVLHPLAGRPMLDHVLASLDCLGIDRRVLVVGDKREQFTAYGERLCIALQEPQLGTGHAAMQARQALADFAGVALILYGDVPLITPDTLARLTAAVADGPEDRALAVLGFKAADPGAYGRLVVGPGDSLMAIVEYKDATSSERAIALCNSGVMAVRAPLLFALLDAVGNDNAAGEYYLTDIVAVAERKRLAATVVMAEEREVLGVNARDELARLERLYQDRRRAEAMAAGVTLIDPESVFFSFDTRLGEDVTIAPHVVFGPGVTVEEGASIHAFSHLAGCHVRAGASVGPFARLRGGADIGAKAKVGNFVEIKKTTLGAGAKASHLAYLGDADIGPDANIGAGTITCNYDGFFKYRTVIGAGAFIGSNTALVAPVSVGAGAIIGAGSVIAKDVAKDALAVARGEQWDRPGAAARFRERKAAAKAAGKMGKKD